MPDYEKKGSPSARQNQEAKDYYARYGTRKKIALSKRRKKELYAALERAAEALGEPPTWLRNELRKSRAMEVMAVAIDHLAANEADFSNVREGLCFRVGDVRPEKLGLHKVFRPTDTKPVASVVKFLHNRYVQYIVRDEVRRKMEEVGVEEMRIYRLFAQMVDEVTATDEEGNPREVDPKYKLAIYDRGAKLFGIEAAERHSEVTEEVDYSHYLPSGEKKQVRARRTRELKEHVENKEDDHEE